MSNAGFVYWLLLTGAFAGLLWCLPLRAAAARSYLLGALTFWGSFVFYGAGLFLIPVMSEATTGARDFAPEWFPAMTAMFAYQRYNPRRRLTEAQDWIELALMLAAAAGFFTVDHLAGNPWTNPGGAQPERSPVWDVFVRLGAALIVLSWFVVRFRWWPFEQEVGDARSARRPRS